MRWLLNLLKSRTFLICFGVLLLIALIFVGGALVVVDMLYRLLAVIIVLIVVVAVLAIQFARANRSSDEIERSIMKQAAQQVVGTRPDKQAEIQALQEQLEQAILKLKQSKLGRGQRGRAALYALPWYLFIGPSGAGKTTAIANSGLQFPLGSDRVRGVGGTRNCDWFFTDSAIILDTAGRYTTEQEDIEEWFAFLDTLKQHRSERPINGVLVGIALSDLITATPDEIEWHADNIRRRADELVQRLGISFPIYLVFTKCDLLQGFVEFFGQFSRREREQIWGCTLTHEQMESSGLRGVFEDEFDRLVDALTNRRTDRLSRPMNREERRKVYAFSLQMASVKDNLALFVDRLFQVNPYQESPVFRGFYFTSGTQEGVPLDRVIQALARQFDLPASSLDQFEVQQETKSYFIKDLFTNVVVPDQYMVQRTSKVILQSNVQRLGVAVAAAVLLGLFVLGASQALIRGKLSLRQTEQVAAPVKTVRWGTGQQDDVRDLENVDRLRQHVDQLDKFVWLGLGLNRNDEVLEPTRDLYLSKVQAFVQAYPLQQLENRMRQTVRSGGLADSVRDFLWNDLKAYLLLTDRLAQDTTKRFRDEVLEQNQAFLVERLTPLALDPVVAGAGGTGQDALDEPVRQQLTDFVEALQEDQNREFNADDDLIDTVRDRISEPLSVRVLYDRLQREGGALRAFRLDDIAGRYGYLLTSQDEVPGMYTKDGYYNYVTDKIEEMSENPRKGDWVNGPQRAAASNELDDEEKVKKELLERYFNDYVGEWQRFLSSVRVKPFGSLSAAADALNHFNNPDESPLGLLLRTVSNETRLKDDEDQVNFGAAVIDKAKNLISSALGREMPPVDERFERLHRLNAGQFVSGEAADELYAALTSLENVGGKLTELGDDPALAAEYTATVLQGNGADLGQALQPARALNRYLPDDVRQQLFVQPVLNAWGTLRAAASAHINTQWRDIVYEPFQDLARQYPFNAGTDQDAPVADVAEFFNPEMGRVAEFLTVLDPYIIQQDVDRPRSWQRGGIGLSAEARRAIKKAQAITDGLFEGGTMQVRFELNAEVPLQIPEQSVVPRHVTLRLLGSSDYVYDLGRRFPRSYVWPGDAGAVLTIGTDQGPFDGSYHGDWALFRMLQNADIRPRSTASRTEFEVRWTFNRNQYQLIARYDLKSEQGSSNPFRNLSGFFAFRPPSSL